MYRSSWWLLQPPERQAHVNPPSPNQHRLWKGRRDKNTEMGEHVHAETLAVAGGRHLAPQGHDGPLLLLRVELAEVPQVGAVEPCVLRGKRVVGGCAGRRVCCMRGEDGCVCGGRQTGGESRAGGQVMCVYDIATEGQGVQRQVEEGRTAPSRAPSRRTCRCRGCPAPRSSSARRGPVGWGVGVVGDRGKG